MNSMYVTVLLLYVVMVTVIGTSLGLGDQPIPSGTCTPGHYWNGSACMDSPADPNSALICSSDTVPNTDNTACVPLPFTHGTTPVLGNNFWDAIIGVLRFIWACLVFLVDMMTFQIPGIPLVLNMIINFPIFGGLLYGIVRVVRG